MSRFRKSAIIVVTLLLAAGLAHSQRPQMDLGEFSRMLMRGIITNESSAGVTFRFRSVRERPAGAEVIIERSEDGSLRAVQTNAAKTSADECIMIGDTLYERSSFGVWYSQTLAEYNEAEKVRTDLMKKALSGKDTALYNRLSSQPNPATLAAINKAPFTAYGLFQNFPPGATVIDDGYEVYKGRRLSRYIVVGIVTKFNPPSGSVKYSSAEYRFGFDFETGFLVKARSKIDWVYDTRTDTFINSYEWELDPRIVVQAPAAAKKRVNAIPTS